MTELALTPDRRWGLDGAALVGIAADAGFVAVGLGADGADDVTSAALAARGLRCHELLALVVGSDDEGTLRYAARLADAAARIGAEHVLTTFTAPLTATTAATVARCAAMFADAGAALAAEFSPLGPISSIPAALQVVEAAGPHRAGVLIDTWHFFRGDSTWADLEAIPLDQIAYVQFADALEPITDDPMVDTLDHRLLPGLGTFALERFATTLLDRGWRGLVSAEVLTRAPDTPPPAAFATAAFAATAPYWS